MTSWYVQFATSPLVVAYSPRSRFASQLSAIARGQKPLADLFTLMEQPGFLLGRTNPQTDPQGQAFYEMVELAQSELHLPATTVSRVLGPLDNPSQVFAETTLESRLQAGQLDAASAFLSQAVELHLPYIALPAAMNFGNPALASRYATASVNLGKGQVVHGVPLVLDITTLGKREPQAADAFVAYALSPAGRRALRTGGYTLLTPTVFGNRSAVPAEVRKDLSGSS
jgi:molybdate/tungstate transport system substrate-binding protein